MPQLFLNPCRMHCRRWKAGQAFDAHAGEFGERKKGWKRSDCPVFSSGSLPGRFDRQSAELRDED